MVTLKAVVEALLFSSQKPLTPKEILQVVRLGTEYAGEEEAADLVKITEESIFVQTVTNNIGVADSSVGRCGGCF